jgi:nitroreductase
MEKIHHLITDRWSPKAFDDRPLDAEQIRLLFEAAKWAPSASNAQPWRFIYATREMPEYEVFLALMNEDNRIWASAAPLLVLPLAQAISTYKNRRNRLAFYETGMAVGNLLIQATAMGLYVHQMGGYDAERSRAALGIPDRYEPMAMMAVGYKGDPGRLPGEVAAWDSRERTRMDTDQLMIRGKCEET